MPHVSFTPPHARLALLVCAAAMIGCTAFSAPALAQDESVTRRAADEVKFRVIKRFDVTEPAALTFASVEWPFDGAVRAAVERRDWKEAWKGMAGIDPSGISPDFAFLAGYVAVEAGETEKARDFLIRARKSETLEPLAHLWAARAAREQKEWQIAAAEAARVPAGSIYSEDAAHILARALLESGRAEDALRAARALRKDGDAEGMLVYADALRARGEKGDLVEAAKTYHLIAQRHPLTDAEKSARGAVAELLPQLPNDARADVDLAVYSKDATVARYTRLFDRHRSETVVEELPAKLADWKKGSDTRCEALYLVAKSYTKLRKHQESLPWYARLAKECTGDDRRRGLYLGGKAAWNAGEKATALAIYKVLVKENPDHSYADDALYFSARILREENRADAARETLRSQVKTYPKGDMAKDAHWLIVREHFVNARYADVVAYVDDLTATGENDLYSRGRLAYFRARALQLSKNSADAKKAYHAVAKDFPASYYALLALNRIAAMEEGGANSGATNLCTTAASVCASLSPLTGKPIGIPETLRDDEHFDQGLALVQIGLDGLARRPFTALARNIGDDEETLWALSYLLDRAGAYPLSHDIVRRQIDDGWVDGYPLATNPAAARRWSIAYPRPFDELVTKWSNKRDVPGELIWAIMREESGFTPGIESWANARGLMQLMPGTARVVAREDGMGSVSTRRLFEPDVAVRLGSAYIADLSSKVNGHPALIIAGYNGGWGNVSRWLDEAESRDFDLWVEDIPYGQTRKYTKRVLGTYWAYHFEGGQPVVPRIALTL